MHNYKMLLSYDGSKYKGWQRLKKENQTDLKSIQARIEDSLSKLLRENILITASGRTDSGVHALNQSVNFKSNEKISNLKKFKDNLNSILPDDISINSIEEVSLKFHARFDSKSKIYEYHIWNSENKNPFLRKTSYFEKNILDINLMKDASNVLIGKHDFKAFKSNRGSDKKTTIRTIDYIKITKDKELIKIEIKADSFLYNMVRIIIATLIKVGQNKLTKEDVLKILESKERSNAPDNAVAHGLFLKEVIY